MLQHPTRHHHTAAVSPQRVFPGGQMGGGASRVALHLQVAHFVVFSSYIIIDEDREYVSLGLSVYRRVYESSTSWNDLVPLLVAYYIDFSSQAGWLGLYLPLQHVDSVWGFFSLPRPHPHLPWVSYTFRPPLFSRTTGLSLFEKTPISSPQGTISQEKKKNKRRSGRI